MGNHTAGRAMGLVAEALVRARSLESQGRGRDGALELLDQICNPWRGADAEFEAENPARPGYTHPDYARYTDPEAPLGKLMVEAFAPNGLADLPRYVLPGAASDEAQEEATDRFYAEVYEPFKRRYDLC